MKKIFASVLFIAILFSLTTPSVFAENSFPEVESINYAADGGTTIYYDDGSVLTISPVQVSEADAQLLATSKTINADRIASYTDASDVLQWKYTLTGHFSYVYGVSSTCTGASYTQEICDSGWEFSDGAAIKSGNTAIGNGVYKLKFLFFTAKTYTIDISLTCDIYGNIT